jgi:ClpP class serine protease
MSGVQALSQLVTLDVAKRLTMTGEVVSGTRAVELGLADRTGLLDDAIDDAMKLANAPNAKVVIYRRPYGFSGSIYAQGGVGQPQAGGVMELKIPGVRDPLPSGFYYLWNP